MTRLEMVYEMPVSPLALPEDPKPLAGGTDRGSVASAVIYLVCEEFIYSRGQVNDSWRHHYGSPDLSSGRHPLLLAGLGLFWVLFCLLKRHWTMPCDL